ncbi:MAG: hypothetical protein D6689_13645 [Deltaproteobacteria bacterium]|nr:MAG: hypothetical protein D6689_13645 [Deltaproteobacteria bacterium]
MRPSDVVLRFLASVATRGEIDYYLALFRSDRPERFAVLSVDPRVDRAALDLDLRYLAALDLHPYVARPDDDLLAVVRARRAKKVVFLGPWPGLEPRGAPVPSIVDVREVDALAPRLPSDQRAVVEEARRILDGADHDVTAAVTGPLDLLRELFTVRGAGTLIRRAAPIAVARRWADVDVPRVAALMRSAFGAEPHPAVFARAVAGLYVAGDYDGAAVVEPAPLGAYLSKFAVDAGARGAGIGRDLWRAVTADHPALVWRARPDNPIVSWYTAHCDGMARGDRWVVYWRGLEPQDIPRAIEFARAAPVDFDRRM